MHSSRLWRVYAKRRIRSTSRHARCCRPIKTWSHRTSVAAHREKISLRQTAGRGLQNRISSLIRTVEEVNIIEEIRRLESSISSLILTIHKISIIKEIRQRQSATLKRNIRQQLRPPQRCLERATKRASGQERTRPVRVRKVHAPQSTTATRERIQTQLRMPHRAHGQNPARSDRL